MYVNDDDKIVNMLRRIDVNDLAEYLDPKYSYDMTIQISDGEDGYGEWSIGVDNAEYCWVNDTSTYHYDLCVEYVMRRGKVVCTIRPSNNIVEISTCGELKELYNKWVRNKYKQYWKEPKMLQNVLYDEIARIRSTVTRK